MSWMMKVRKYNIWTIGCQMNEADSRHLGSQLEALGYAMTEKADDADLVVLNTCVVRQQAEDRAIGRLQFAKELKMRNPELTIGLMGCMVGMREAPRLKKQFPFVDVFMPPSDPGPLMDFLREQQDGTEEDDARIEEIRSKNIQNAIQDEEYILPALQRSNTVQANVPIVLGCSHACTFCVIPYRRGPERSRPAADILAEVRKLVAQGVREVMLLGQIVDRYGTDFEEDYGLAELLKDVAAIPGILRVRYLTGHPNYMTDKIIEVTRDEPKVMPHFELPVQAGNDKVLEDMKRGYTCDDFRALIERVRRICPDNTINTDVIVGFPGETDEEFQGSYDLLKELELDKVHLAKYSERPKTIAARKMEDDVSDEEKERRRLLIDELVDDILARKNKQWMGQEVEVLVESRHKGKWRGRTPHNRLVFFESDENMRGALVDIKIDFTSPYSMRGDLVRVKVPAIPQTPDLSTIPMFHRPLKDSLNMV
ncbi:tRNA (N6-isopentenyl adenosine(37)-C2)-methylthiotransferase MiaB [Kiritimatiellota bacterium B12222]|nr:tRNA (N6-isopentenyl adenosine(37)-C2)-methylthiotransferase MiaB [Kiritimatiellota bacterium B12222]